MRKSDAVVVEYPMEWAKEIESRPLMTVVNEKRKAQKKFIRDHMNYRNTDLADICGCNESMVRRLRREIEKEGAR